jgi:hypothetical protein
MILLNSLVLSVGGSRAGSTYRAAIQARRGLKLVRVMGLETCKKWQRSFFYVKNRGLTDRIKLPPFVIGTPSRANWKYSPDAKDTEMKAMAK